MLQRSGGEPRAWIEGLALLEKRLLASSLEGKSILVVDDDPDILNAMRLALEESGAKVTTAGDGDQAIAMAESCAPDLVVLDAMLPKRSGFLVMDKLKSPQNERKPRVIMITGAAGKRHQAWAESRGVDGYLAKPFRMERLVESAERILSA